MLERTPYKRWRTASNILVLLTIIASTGLAANIALAEDSAVWIPHLVDQSAASMEISRVSTSTVVIMWSGACNPNGKIRLSTTTLTMYQTIPITCHASINSGSSPWNEATVADVIPASAYYYRLQMDGRSFGGRFVLRSDGKILYAVNRPLWIPLARGENGANVQMLQEFLYEQDLLPQSDIIGYYGRVTQQAVSAFQEAHARDILAPAGLSHPTGYAGPRTIYEIDAIWGV